MNEEIQYLAEAIGANSQEDFQQKLASMGIKSQEQLKELLKATKIAKQQGIKANQFVTWLQQQTQKAQKGAKLNYLKTLYNGCPDGYVKYKEGGIVKCKKCEQGNIINSIKAEVEKCGGKMKKKKVSKNKKGGTVDRIEKSIPSVSITINTPEVKKLDTLVEPITFNEAFAAARKKGMKVFTYKGNKYTTETREEATNKIRTNQFNKIDKDIPQPTINEEPIQELAVVKNYDFAPIEIVTPTFDSYDLNDIFSRNFSLNTSNIFKKLLGK